MVDDDRQVRQLTTTALSYCVNREVRSFGSGRLAWDYIRQGGEVDIVISDVDMPDMTGMDLMTRVKQKHPDKIFIIMSGVVDYENQSRTLGASAFLAKPFEIQDLFNIVQEFVIEET